MLRNKQIALNKLVPANVSLEFVQKCVDPVLKNYDLSIALVSAVTIKSINARYRKINQVTDVLSFSYTKTCGELVICYSQIKRQARAHQVPLKQELARMLVHGALHLKGYLDDTESAARVMHIKEDKILSHVKF